MAKLAKGSSKKHKQAQKPMSRKDLRKQKLELKKQNKRLFFASKTHGKELVAQAKLENAKANEPKSKKKKPSSAKNANVDPFDIPIEQLLSGEVDSADEQSIDSDFEDEEVESRLKSSGIVLSKKSATQQSTAQKKQHKTNRPDAETTHRKELKRQKELEQSYKKQRIKQLKMDNEEEDKMIARLEKKLKLNKTKDKNRLVRKMFSDGLDYALEFCLNDEEEKEKQLLKEKRRQAMKYDQNNDWSDDEVFDDGDDDLADAADSEISENNEGDTSLLDDDEASEGESENDDETVAETNGFMEDIYGRKRDKDGNIINDADDIADHQQQAGLTKYIPPHQRSLLALNGDDKQAAILERLRKQCKGQLNRLSEANLHKISTTIEDMYMKNSRYNMNETLTKLLNEALIAKSLANERMVQEHMVLLAYLHAQIGSEIGAHFLQMFIEQFDTFLNNIEQLQIEDKRLNNVVLVLSYLYIFKIYEHRLLQEIIKRLASQLCEKAVECLLLIFQTVGFKLRKDDPLAFKQMMLDVQQNIAAAPLEMKDNLRLKFMVDILNAVKNNNISKLPQFDPELAENLRKRLKGMLTNDKYVVTLNIAMDDLLRADQVGKWWVVGSAWTGNMNDLAAANKSSKNADKSTSNAAQRFSDKLLELAKQQKMNTEERRNIFCIIMSAEDYVDAFEKILHLSIKDQRSIAYVIIHCCLNEKRSNPYYSHLALKFCNYNRKFQLAFQFASWDRINDIEALSKPQVRNLAKFLLHLFLNGGLLLSALKVVDFLQLKKLSFLLMKDIVVGLLTHDNDGEAHMVFEKVAKNPKLGQFKNNIRLFMHHFLLKDDGVKLKLNEQQMTLLRKRLEYIDTVLAYVDL